MVQQRKQMGGVNAARENQSMVQKQIKILENRLDQALVKFNQALAKNKSLREAIDDLRRERVVFDTIYRKLERELHEKKKQMANVIEISNNAYEHRDNYQLEIAAIEQANRKEQDDFEAQMVELGRLLENELKTPEPRALGAPPSAGDAQLPQSSPSAGGRRKQKQDKAERERRELQVGDPGGNAPSRRAFARLHGMSASRPRRRRDPVSTEYERRDSSPRNVRVAAAAPPRFVKGYPRSAYATTAATSTARQVA